MFHFRFRYFLLFILCASAASVNAPALPHAVAQTAEQQRQPWLPRDEKRIYSFTQYGAAMARRAQFASTVCSSLSAFAIAMFFRVLRRDARRCRRFAPPDAAKRCFGVQAAAPRRAVLKESIKRVSAPIFIRYFYDILLHVMFDAFMIFSLAPLFHRYSSVIIFILSYFFAVASIFTDIILLFSDFIIVIIRCYIFLFILLQYSLLFFALHVSLFAGFHIFFILLISFFIYIILILLSYMMFISLFSPIFCYHT